MELAAAGVSISLFNQASKITIFPLVSITTSFVAEEDTIQKLNTKAAENGNSKAKFGETIVPEDHMLQDMEKGTPKVMNTDAPTEFREEKDESKEYNATGNNDTNIGDGTSLSLSLSLSLSIHACGKHMIKKKG